MLYYHATLTFVAEETCSLFLRSGGDDGTNNVVYEGNHDNEEEQNLGLLD